MLVAPLKRTAVLYKQATCYLSGAASDAQGVLGHPLVAAKRGSMRGETRLFQRNI